MGLIGLRKSGIRHLESSSHPSWIVNKYSVSEHFLEHYRDIISAVRLLGYPPSHLVLTDARYYLQQLEKVRWDSITRRLLGLSAFLLAVHRSHESKTFSELVDVYRSTSALSKRSFKGWKGALNRCAHHLKIALKPHAAEIFLPRILNHLRSTKMLSSSQIGVLEMRTRRLLQELSDNHNGPRLIKACAYVSIAAKDLGFPDLRDRLARFCDTTPFSSFARLENAITKNLF